MTNDEKQLKYRNTLEKLKEKKEGKTGKYMTYCDEKLSKLLEASKNEVTQPEKLSLESVKNDWQGIWNDITIIETKD